MVTTAAAVARSSSSSQDIALNRSFSRRRTCAPGLDCVDSVERELTDGPGLVGRELSRDVP